MRDNDQAGDGRPARPAPPDTRPGPGTPTRGSSRTGTEPFTARSPLRLRRPLSAVFLAPDEGFRRPVGPPQRLTDRIPASS